MKNCATRYGRCPLHCFVLASLLKDYIRQTVNLLGTQIVLKIWFHNENNNHKLLCNNELYPKSSEEDRNTLHSEPLKTHVCKIDNIITILTFPENHRSFNFLFCSSSLNGFYNLKQNFL